MDCIPVVVRSVAVASVHRLAVLIQPTSVVRAATPSLLTSYTWRNAQQGRTQASFLLYY